LELFGNGEESDNLQDGGDEDDYESYTHYQGSGPN
jgi:hypothetical protein